MIKLIITFLLLGIMASVIIGVLGFGVVLTLFILYLLLAFIFSFK